MVERYDLRDLRIELMRILDLLRSELNRQRDRGRTPAVDVVQGNVIEEGEAEGLVHELRCELEQSIEATQPNADRNFASDNSLTWQSTNNKITWPPLIQAVKAFELSQGEYDALVLALAVELDSRFGRLIAFLNDHAGRTRPTLGMATLLAASQSDPFAPYPSQWLNRTVFRDGLLEIEGEGPLPGLTLRVPREMLLRLTSSRTQPIDATPHVEYCPQPLSALTQLVLPEALREQATNWAQQLRVAAGAERPLVVVGPLGSGRRTLARCIAFEAGWSTTVVEFDGEHFVDRLKVARREGRWHCSALVLRLKENSPFTQLDWRMLWNELRDIRRPLFLVLPLAAMHLATAASPFEPAVINLAEPDLTQRSRLWQALLPSGHKVPLEACDRLAARFRFGPGRIHRVIRRSLSQAELLPENVRGLTAQQLEQSCRDIGGAAMGALAQKISLPFQRGDLIISDQLQAEFDLAIAWIQSQRQVLDDWGFANRIPYGRGLTALFAGPPGTGKTMAAQVLARELGVDLFRVDFSRLMSKWIGETEKNLSQLFDEAHSAGVALFFDEGDAVAGKRSEVKDAHDRYANLEISYLLQRMEEHEGISIFATNRLGDLDEAFTRRFHFVLDFPKPNAEQRLRIWEGMFPSEVQRADNLNLARFAHQYELTGGEIMNVVLAAAFLAAQSGQALNSKHIQAGVQRELLKSGRLSDM